LFNPYGVEFIYFFAPDYVGVIHIKPLEVFASWKLALLSLFI